MILAVLRYDAARRQAAKHLAPSRTTEARYVLDVLRIMANVHADTLRVAKERHIGSSARSDASDGLPKRFRQHIFNYVADAVPAAYDRMAGAVDKKNKAGAEKLGLRAKAYDIERRRVPIKDIVFPGGVKGVPPVWEEAKTEYHRARMRAGHAPEPVELTTVGTGGELRLINGIHRTQAALEAGHTHMPAIIQHPKGKGPRGPAGSRLIGISPKAIGVENIVENARAANVKLITRASDVFLAQVEDVLRDSFGDRVEDLAASLQERVGVSNSRATLIARDQTTKLNAAITQHRQTQAGVERFTWSTSHDERVRASHAELDGRTFTWAEGLPADVADEVDEEEGATPGTPVQCRCVPIPVLDDEDGDMSTSPAEDDEAAE